MSETANNDGGTSAESEKPVHDIDVKFPPFPGNKLLTKFLIRQICPDIIATLIFTDPTEEEFEEDISDTERIYYRTKFSGVLTVNLKPVILHSH